MKVLFISRKTSSEIGGLSRFFADLTSNFPQPHYLLSPTYLIFPIFRISLIHLCDATLLPLGILLKFFLRKPLTLTAHGLDLTYPNPLYQKMLKLLLPKADAIILDSHAAKVLLSPFNIPKYKIFIIPLGISINHFKFSISPNFPNLPNFKNKLILLTVGNLVLRKGHVWFIKNVFSKLSEDFIYLIVGNGPKQKEINLLIHRLKLFSRVHLLGRLTDLQLAFIFNLAHIYVAPNQKEKGNFEGFGIACGEGAAMGLPVIASNIDGISEVIKDGENGLLVNPSPHEFIQAINSLKNPLKRRLLGKKARLYTKRGYNWNKTIKAYINVFKQVVGKT